MKCFLLALSAFVAATSSAVNLITNGSFENPVVTVPYLTVLAGGSALTGWNVTGVSIDVISQTFNPTYPARIGVQCVDLSGTPGPGTIEQSFATTASQQYVFGWSASSNGASTSMDVLVDGNLLFTIVTPTQGTWVDYSYVITATSAISSVGFRSNVAGNQGPLVDRVYVEQVVPEPASLLVVGGGLLALRRKKLKS